jgi:hypothetical protein
VVYFSRFGILYQEKSGNPDHKHFIPLLDGTQSWRFLILFFRQLFRLFEKTKSSRLFRLHPLHTHGNGTSDKKVNRTKKII